MKPRRRKKRGGEKHKKAKEGSEDGASGGEEESAAEEFHAPPTVPASGRGAKRPLTEAEKAKEGRSRSSGVACKEPYAHLASTAYAIGALIVSIAVVMRTYR